MSYALIFYNVKFISLHNCVNQVLNDKIIKKALSSCFSSTI